ncbi:MAG: TetR family transcriptional regulator [Hyphomonadaceae bacterium]|nr:TetR family transcriptional regulator [Hyphomonadaceae bacterium]
MYQIDDSDLLLHGQDIVVESGLKALTLRNLAQRAGVSASLLNYRFGARETLVARLFEHARQADLAFWNACREEVSSLQITPSSLPALTLSIAQKALWQAHRSQMIRWICITAAARDRQYQSEAAASANSGMDFWVSLLEQAHLPVKLAPSLAAIMTGAIRIGLVSRRDARALSWMSDIILRATARLFTLPVIMHGDSPARADFEQATINAVAPPTSARTDAPERIVSSAASLILSAGLDAVTHREIARHAGLSLSSLTHHFASLDLILQSAFGHIYSRARAETDTNLHEDMPISKFIETVLPRIFEQARKRGQEGVAIDEIILATARSTATASLSSGLLAMTGTTSTAMLQSLHEGKQADRLDGQIFRFAMGGLSEQAAAMPAGARDAWLLEHCNLFLCHYFEETSGTGAG